MNWECARFIRGRKPQGRSTSSTMAAALPCISTARPARCRLFQRKAEFHVSEAAFDGFPLCKISRTELTAPHYVVGCAEGDVYVEPIGLGLDFYRSGALPVGPRATVIFYDKECKFVQLVREIRHEHGVEALLFPHLAPLHHNHEIGYGRSVILELFFGGCIESVYAAAPDVF